MAIFRPRPDAQIRELAHTAQTEIERQPPSAIAGLAEVSNPSPEILLPTRLANTF